MKFMIDGRYTPGADPASQMNEERQRTRELKDAGVLETVWRRPDRGGVYLLIEAESQDAADAVLATLPFVAAGIMEYDIEQVEQI